MFNRACLTLALLAGVFATSLSTRPAHAVTDSWADLEVRRVIPQAISSTERDDADAPVSGATVTPRGNELPPAAPNPGPPAETSPQSALSEIRGPSWVFAALGISLMVAGTVLTVTARRASRRRG